MKYHIYAPDRASGVKGDFYKIGELTPGASLDNCWFGEVRLWHPENGFRRGQFKIGEYWLVDDEEHEDMRKQFDRYSELAESVEE